MNVLGKIKSKKLKIQEGNYKKDVIQQSKEEIKQKQIMNFKYETQYDQQVKKQEIKQIKQLQCTRTPQYIDYIQNTNVLTKQKQIAIRQKQPSLFRTLNSASNNFSSYFQSKKQTKKSWVYSNQNSSMGQQLSFTNQSSKQRSSQQSNNDQPQQTDEQFTMSFDFLLSNKQKKQVKKLLHLSKEKVLSIKQIQQQLKQQNNQVICFFIKKWHSCGDIYIFEGELESLKKRYIQIQTKQGINKIYDRIKVKISCGKDILSAPETLARMYISQIVFLTQKQAMITHQYLLKTIQKSKRIKRG